MRSSTIKSIAALALTGAGTALVFGFKTTDELVPAASNPQSSTTSTSGSSGANATGSGTSTGSGSGSSSGTAYADGTWTGTAVSEPWGPFQVQVIVSNGSITSVKVVESPSDRHSTSINSRAVPALTRAALAAQSAEIDMVSGATWTSESYAYSLQSALDEAAAAA